MPPKKKGKGKGKKITKSESIEARPLIKKVEGQEEYAVVSKLLGDRRLRAYCYDGVERLCHIPGRMKRVRILQDDLVLISFREFTEKCSDVIHKYNPDEIKHLRKMGELIDLGNKLEENKEGDEEEEELENFTFEDI